MLTRTQLVVLSNLYSSAVALESLADDDPLWLRESRKDWLASQCAICREFGIRPAQISAIVNNDGTAQR